MAITENSIKFGFQFLVADLINIPIGFSIKSVTIELNS